MASPKESRKVFEGIFAINKPQWASSAGVLRDLQTHFSKSDLFKPWLTQTKRNMTLSHARPKHINNLQVKLGHGGTLDPLATGVLIVGVGKGTKCLQRFLECTKTYECVVLFGAATDSYDGVGKVVSRTDYTHVTRKLVESKLEAFRGKILQKPSVFSALKVDGKKMYEYARAGGEIPEVPARPVEVHELELVEWLEPGSHEFAWPKEEVDSTEKVGAEKLMGIRKQDADAAAKRGRKRSRSTDGLPVDSNSHPKKMRTDSEPALSEALPTESISAAEPDDLVTNSESIPKEPQTADEPAMSGALPAEAETPTAEKDPSKPTGTVENATQDTNSERPPQPPAARLRLTVSSGFYVRSLCHDLGLACDSLALMSSLVRSRQGDYELNRNVLEYSDLEAGPQVWEPKVQGFLEEFMQQEGWEAEDVSDDLEWTARRKEIQREREQKGSQGGYRDVRRTGRSGRGWYKRG